MSDTAPPAAAVAAAQAGAKLISSVFAPAADEIRTALRAIETKIIIPQVNVATGQETAAVLGDVPFIGGLLKGASAAFANGIESGEDMTIEEFFDLLCTNVAQGGAPS